MRSIGTRLYAFVGIVVILIATLGSLGFRSVFRLASSVRGDVATSFENATNASDLLEEARQAHHIFAEAGASGMTTDVRRVDALRDAFEKGAAAVEARRGDTSLAQIRELFARMLTVGRSYVDAAVAQQWVQSGELSVQFEHTANDLLAKLGDVIKVERQRANDSINDVESSARTNALTFGIGLGLCLVGALGVMFFMQRSLVTPLRVLTGATRRIAQEGDLSQRVEVSARDEIGELATSFVQMVDKLRAIPTGLRESSELMSTSVAELSQTSDEGSQTVNRQAAALQETQVTVQEIRQTSLKAAQKADEVLRVAERADEIGRSGEHAIEQTLDGLTEIRAQVDTIAQKIGELAERTRQIGLITETVKDLADQSNMLALNAAIEAVRSGEHGKGFAVVAREIRSLADQSIQATNRVRDILEDITTAIRSTVAITEKGAQKMESSLVQVRSSGESLRELSGIVKENSAAARQIAAAVSQQNAGISQIHAAVSDLNTMMDNTVKQLEATGRLVIVLKRVTERVTGVVRGFRV
jgi:methyl-accepting chemotaxis protein